MTIKDDEYSGPLALVRHIEAMLFVDEHIVAADEIVQQLVSQGWEETEAWVAACQTVEEGK